MSFFSYFPTFVNLGQIKKKRRKLFPRIPTKFLSQKSTKIKRIGRKIDDI